MIKNECMPSDQNLALAEFIINFPNLCRASNQQNANTQEYLDQQAEMTAQQFGLAPTDAKTKLTKIAAAANGAVNMLDARYMDPKQIESGASQQLLTQALALVIENSPQDNSELTLLRMLSVAADIQGLTQSIAAGHKNSIPVAMREMVMKRSLAIAAIAVGKDPKQVLVL